MKRLIKKVGWDYKIDQLMHNKRKVNLGISYDIKSSQLGLIYNMTAYKSRSTNQLLVTYYKWDV